MPLTSLALYMHPGIDFYLNINYKFSEKLALRIFVSLSMLDGKKGEVGKPMIACQVKSWSTNFNVIKFRTIVNILEIDET